MNHSDQARLWTRFHGLRCCSLALIFLATAPLTPLPGDEPAAKKQAKLDGMSALEWFRNLSPEERLKRVEKLASGARAFAPVTRADLVVAAVERGSFQPAKGTDVHSAVRSGRRAVIKWIIDDRTQVKKGDRIVELDSSALHDLLLTTGMDVDRANAARESAEGNLRVLRLQNKLDLRTAEVGLKQAKRLLKKYAGEDEDEKELLKDRIELQELSLEVVKAQGKIKEDVALSAVKAVAAVLQVARAKKAEIEEDIARCVIRAPQDGVVVYHVPDLVRAGLQLIAQGESVREGQKLLRVCTLDHFTVTVRIHEALIGRVRVRQEVALRVDAFPDRVLRGRVTEVDKVASPQRWGADGKVYRVVVMLDDKLPGLQPGMTGGVRIEVDKRARVLQVPFDAVVRVGRETFCYVKVGKGLQRRDVTTGVRGDQSVEIRIGLKEDEQVLRSPVSVAARGKATK